MKKLFLILLLGFISCNSVIEGDVIMKIYKKGDYYKYTTERESEFLVKTTSIK